MYIDWVFLKLALSQKPSKHSAENLMTYLMNFGLKRRFKLTLLRTTGAGKFLLGVRMVESG